MPFMSQEEIDAIYEADPDSFGIMHNELLTYANRSVDREAAKVALDFQRPSFHVAAKSFWINDPNGGCKVGEDYHLFFQHDPYSEKGGNVSWGHVISQDLVKWKHKPIVLTPQPGLDLGVGTLSSARVREIINGIKLVVEPREPE